MSYKKEIFYLTVCFLLTAFLSGCASAPKLSAPLPQGIPGVYHQVKAGQTLFRISKAYNVELEKIARVNRLTDSSRIYAGQVIFIPEKDKALEELTIETDFPDKGGDFIWPARGRVDSYFGMKKDRVKNKGIYIKAKRDASILAARSGRVVFCSENLKGYGKTIIIDHLDGYSTVYAHSSRNLINLGQLVKQGQIIAQVGSTGRADTLELYFEIRKGLRALNPFFYLP